MNTSFSGHFKAHIESLIDQKRSLGYPYETSARILKRFDLFGKTHYPDETVLTKEMIMNWAEQKQGEHVNTLARRITPIRQLAKYMIGIGIEAYVIPPGIPSKQVRYVPHNFTDQELRGFFAETDRCPLSLYSPVRHLVIPVFFRTLYCCGLRHSEARLLNVHDVDLDTGKLTIQQSKGDKDRNVMMSQDLLSLCRIYHTQVSQIFPDRSAFFPNRDGKHYSMSTIDRWFHLCWDHTDVAQISRGNRPRVHDFRHSFAVKRLSLWVKEGKDFNALLPFLSLYLGHAHLTETDYYLHFVPEFFPLFKEKTREYCTRLIPEVNDEA